jgi:iron complex outermembrane receptor protein
LRVDADVQEMGGFVADISYRHRTTDSRYVDAFGGNFLTESEIDTWGFTPRYTLDREIFGHGNRLIIGTDMYWAEQDSDADYFGPSSTASVDRRTFGAYISDEFSLLDNVILSLGARRERVKYDLEQKDLTGFLGPLDEDVTETENGFSAGLTYVYSDDSSVFIRANRSYRFPLTDEFIVYDFSNGQQLINPDLKPQTGRHYETGIKHRFNKNLRGDLTLFRAKIKDEIFYYPAPVLLNTNAPETLHQGVEVGLRADFFDKVTIIGNYTYTDAEFEKGAFDGNTIPAVSEHAAYIGLRVYNVVPGLIFSTSYNYVGSSYLISDQSNDFRKMDDYNTVDCKLSYTFRGVEAVFGINNLTDEEYSEYGVLGGFPTGRNFYPAPDRNWFFGLNYAM